MKPLRLKVKGFSAFRAEQHLDFRNLDTFVIWGQTGAGKTSILDAICYALYGEIERVGREVSHFVAQGASRMSVSLDFSVGGSAHRVTRSMRAGGGQTKILFQSLRDGLSYDEIVAAEEAGTPQDDAWTSHEGGDRVREGTARIVKTLGLGYDSFTRAILLPQGRFQEFLSGDAKQRREILTDLLGLSLFPEMQKVANQWAREAKQQGENLAHIVQTEYADATPGAIAAAEAAVQEATRRDEQARAVAARVEEIAARHRDAVAAAERARNVAAEARTLASEATAAAQARTVAATAIAGADATIATREGAVADATASAAQRADELKAAEAAWGTAADLAAQIARAESVATLRARLAEIDARITTAGARRTPLESSRTTAAASVDEARALVAQLEQARAEAADAWQAAVVRDAVGVACRGLHAGDPCPVCGTALPVDPPPPSKEAEAAERAGKKVAADLEKARTTLQRVEAALAAAERDLAGLTAEDGELQGQRLRASADLDAALNGLAVAFPDGLPEDPLAALVAARTQHAALVAARDGAAHAVIHAERALASAREERAHAASALAAADARIEGLRGEALAGRARDAGADVATPPSTAEDLAVWAAEVATACDGAAERTLAGESALLEEARTAAGELLPNLAAFVGDLGAFLEALGQVAREAAATVAVAEAALARARERAARLTELQAQLEEHGARADRFGALTRELKGDNIVAFLQAEALRLLSLAATEHLQELSDGRYRLEYEGDDFRVVDTWNAEEFRSVKTLSGGETFLASLSLALALSEQVRTLASGARAPLESLFLDEGFGTLDADCLEQVVQAIDRLGGDGRLVGIITHIPELADRMPARFTVHKSQAGSTVSGPAV